MTNGYCSGKQRRGVEIAQEAAVIYSGTASKVLQMTSTTQSQLYKNAEAGDMAALSQISSQLGLPPATSTQRLPLRLMVLNQGSFQAVCLLFFNAVLI